MNKLLSWVAVMVASLLGTSLAAQEVIVLDGLGGSIGRYMQPEVDRLQQAGHQVVYRPWWRWRGAVRAAPNATRVVGFSMGAPRAIQAAQATNATQLELVDPFSRHTMVAPAHAQTAVYRAYLYNRMQSSPVQGNYTEYWYPSNHLGMARRYPLMPRPW